MNGEAEQSALQPTPSPTMGVQAPRARFNSARRDADVMTAQWYQGRASSRWRSMTAGMAAAVVLVGVTRESEMDTCGCPLCGGPLMLLGVLGSLAHVRCRNCGAQFSHAAAADWSDYGQDVEDEYGADY